ncbi:P-loop containing nucleoside triphosphate hydrolase protein [Gongronella butleri]|nr:P-loop containing nucleoside triphosphate hydrolase protein [Gongronella butleri]
MVNTKLIEQRESLPVFDYRQDLIDAVREYSILVIIGETGSGKTTQIPQYLLEEFEDMQIAVTQPRRIAAITVAKRVSEEQGVKLGREVGYRIRFDDCTDESTRLKYMTDGVLLREATVDPLLRQYSVVVIDEAHERTLETDVLLGLLKQTHQLRPDLKILIMSATLQVEKFSDFFDGCPLFSIPGRTFPVDVHYIPDARKLSALKANFVDLAVDTAWYIHSSHASDPGDILVFLTGQNDIERACKLFSDRAKQHNQHHKLSICPLYASMETWDQKSVFAPPPNGVRKVVFATNVAQTSVTIPGIMYVVDSGFIKEKSYDPSTGMDALLVTEISQATAIQRAGRAGRTAAGKVYRLFTEDCFEAMRVDPIPEIQRSSLMTTVLGLKKRGILDVLHFPFLDPPDTHLVKTALKHLYLLGAIDDVGRLTPLGDKMSAFPLNPSLSRVLVAAATEYHCSHEVVTIISLMAGELDLFRTPSAPRSGRGGHDPDEMARRAMEAEQCKLRLAHHSGDHMTYLNVWTQWRKRSDNAKEQRQWCRDNYVNAKVLESAVHVREQLIQVMDKLKLPLSHAPTLKKKKIDAVPILQAFLTGYFSNVANRQKHRHVFSHYSPDTHLLRDGGVASMEQSHLLDDGNALGSSALVALHLHPLCSLSDAIDRDRVRFSDLSWVMYTHVTYTNRAVMKGVSKIVWDWVKTSDGLARVHKLPKTQLNGIDRPDVEEMENEEIERQQHLDDQLAQKAREKQEQEELNQKKRRADQIEAIRLRALSRRRVQ